jgi:phosphatidate phosphatase APP1
MWDWKQTVKKNLHRFERRIDHWRYERRKRRGRLGPLCILPFRGYGSEEGVFLRGRVLADKGISGAGENDTVWTNLRMMYRRFQSDEVPNVWVCARFGNVCQQAATDEEGYFEFQFVASRRTEQLRTWFDVEFWLRDEVVPRQPPVRAVGKVLLPPATCRLGIISDIDDTILPTGTTRFRNILRNTFLLNARTRTPFEGVPAFYQALKDGRSAAGPNPLFYVSNSPWNLYDFLEDFLRLHGLPPGPVLLRDLGEDETQFFTYANPEHKLGQIRRIFRTYPRLLFVLIGDSGQQDPEIYGRLVREFPGRVKVIYIRDVTDPLRAAEVLAIADELRTLGPDVLVMKDTESAARHAARKGLIDWEPAERA